jgi:hypothetical protein
MVSGQLQGERCASLIQEEKGMGRGGKASIQGEKPRFRRTGQRADRNGGWSE